MHYDFIEIGTCDFESILNTETVERGLAVEPIAYYLNRLPSRPSVTKVHAAMGDHLGLVDMYWVHPDEYEKAGVEGWVRGGSAVGKLLWSVEAALKRKNALHLARVSPVEMLTWPVLCQRYYVSSVDFVKIDAEGSDCMIVNNILDASGVMPPILQYERNDAHTVEQLQSVALRMRSFGYTEMNNEGLEVVWARLPLSFTNVPSYVPYRHKLVGG